MAEVEAALQRLNATAATAPQHLRSDPMLLARLNQLQVELAEVHMS